MYHTMQSRSIYSIIYIQALAKVKEISVHTQKDNVAEQRAMLEKCAATSLSSKLIAQHKEFFSKMVVDAVTHLDEMLPLSMIGTKKVKGGALQVRPLLTDKQTDLFSHFIASSVVSMWPC